MNKYENEQDPNVTAWEKQQPTSNSVESEGEQTKEGFTPGEWKISEASYHREKYIVDEHYFLISTVSPANKENEEAEANARLIAEAPKMYAFIKEMATRYENSEWIAGEAKAILSRINQKK